MLNRSAKFITASLFALGITISTADAAVCQTRDTLLGAGAGGIAGNVLSHGSPVGTIAGVVGGGLIGNDISKSDCRSHYVRHAYYDRAGHKHYRWVARQS